MINFPKMPWAHRIGNLTSISILSRIRSPTCTCIISIILDCREFEASFDQFELPILD